MNEIESLNRAIHEEVALFPYDAAWPTLFEQESERLQHLFPGEFLAIEHIGSTAVPGLSAKPIIDILAGVDSIARADKLMAPLCQANYATSIEYNASLVERRWLMRYANGRRTHHLHLMVYSSDDWHRRLAFRNSLRESAELAKQYEMNKQQWAVEFKTDREAYTAAKGAFIQAALNRAPQFNQ